MGNLKYCQENKGLEIFAWCIMTSHIQLIIRAGDYLYSSTSDYAGD
jgi:REP element-mobilizing transposase RayT